jgi:hypothetical protein
MGERRGDGMTGFEMNFHKGERTLIGDPLLRCCVFNRKWPQQKQFSSTFRNIVFCEAKASKGKKNDILEN